MPAVTARPAVARSAADRRMRRLLRLPEDGPRESIIGAHNAYSKSIAISALRCTITYLLLPLLAPVVDLSGTAGPIIGIVLSAVSIVAIVFSTRRFFAADHRYRWAYAGFGASILLLLFVSALVDVVALTS
jgi:heme O synthase-like polyprenyltransferase